MKTAIIFYTFLERVLWKLQYVTGPLVHIVPELTEWFFNQAMHQHKRCRVLCYLYLKRNKH